jgi:hypothetical protein
MLEFEKVLVDNKDYIYAVARLGLSPDKSSSIVQSILEAYKNIDSTIFDMAICNTCLRAYENSFKTILAYCDSVNWFVELPKAKSK